jgi:O-antigen/teichoic acid export membrane protein
MSSHRSILRGGATLGFGQVVSQVCSFGRNIIVARLISPKDFGIAATFAVTVSIFEMISNMSADKLLIQAKDGDEAPFQKTAQLIHAGRGLMNASIVFLAGGPIASLFGEPQARWAFECVALVPLLRGLLHLDTSRLQREMRFRPAVTVDVGSQLLVTAAALPLAFWLRDYTAMLWVLVLQAGSATIISHLVAQRDYGWAWEKSYARRIISFGWPLLINGLLLFIIMDGDRVIIGSAHRMFPTSSYTLADLGVYSVGFALAQAPAGFTANICTSLFLPLLSRAQESRPQFERRYLASAQIVSLMAIVVATGFILAGGRFVTLVYGQRYAAAGIYIGWLSAMWALRILRSAPTTAAMAYGDTRNAMVSNLARSSALIGLLFVAATGRSLVWIAVCGFLGELVALMVCVWRLQLRHGLPATLCLKPYAAFFVGTGIAGLAAAGGAANFGLPSTFFFTACLIAAQLAGMAFLFSGIREELRAAVVKLRSLVTMQDIPDAAP